jgi:hypothetical protein
MKNKWLLSIAIGLFVFSFGQAHQRVLLRITPRGEQEVIPILPNETVPHALERV